MEENKGVIISKSKELFERFGYQKTTLTDIAKSVGKVKTAIYYYFSGKEEIFAQLVKVEAEEFYLKLKSAIQKEEVPLNQLEIYIESRIKLMQKISKRYNFLKQEFFELMPIVEKNREEFYQLEIQMVAEILEKGLKRKDFHLESCLFSATMLVNSLKGLEVQMFVTDKILIENMNLENFKNFILYGVVQKNKTN
jgi:AcrR family transcriptional regulator